MLIVVEGCVGVGKSTVAKGLAEHRGSDLLLENFDANPFLEAFYAHPSQNAIETEFAFLLLHFHQLKARADCTTHGEVISDFHLWKDLIYAELNLKDDRTKRVFRELHALCLESTPPPALMVFLSATTDLIVSRIWARKRSFELEIDPAYYARVNDAYESAFEDYQGRKVRLSMSEWDFVARPSLFERLSLLIDQELTSCE